MPHRKYHRGWVPEAPPVIHPWGHWATYHLMELRERLHVLERELGEHAVEMEKRRLILERDMGARSSWKQSIVEHLWKIGVGVALMIGSWLVTGKLPPLNEVLPRL